MTAEAELEEGLRRAFTALAREQGVDACGLRVRAAPLDATAIFAHAAEAQLVERAVPLRRRELATGRRLAHALLAESGCASAPLLPGARRAPEWPTGFVGSISHAHGAVAVAVASCPPILALGIDVESAADLRADLFDTVLTQPERTRLAALFGGSGGEIGAWAKLAFCAKECAYKTWSRDLVAVPEFSDVEIEFETDDGAFRARLAPRVEAARTLRGRYARCGDRVFAAALVAAT